MKKLFASMLLVVSLVVLTAPAFAHVTPDGYGEYGWICPYCNKDTEIPYWEGELFEQHKEMCKLKQQNSANR